MARRNNGGFLLLLIVAALLLAASARPKSSAVTPAQPNCPDGVCPLPNHALDSYFRSQSRPAVEMPMEWREPNWGGGSCVHATTVALLRWVGQHEMATWWRSTYSGGEIPSRHTERLRDSGLRYVVTRDGDQRLLEWALETRRGCGVNWPPRHCVALVGRVNGEAVIMDNNHIGRYTRIPWDRFLREWTGWAFAFVYDPPPAIPVASLRMHRPPSLLELLPPDRRLSVR